MQTETRKDDLAKTYEPATVEARRYAEWLAAGVFHDEPDPARPPFVISMPPPNITGRAHLGHGSTWTPMDILTRYHRMLGDNAAWIPGQDHAAIATEAVLVRELAKEGLTRNGLGREAFIARAWQWREQYGAEIYQSFRALGFGPDWERDRFTLDAELSAAVVKVFVELYREGLIYRGTRLVNWDPVSQSTLSDAEVEDEERDGFLWQIRYPAEDGSFAIEVATTRPETMLGDVAIAVHPEDERYTGLIGKRVVVPLAGRPIPIVADEAVERDFGTGAVKVTPAHDPLDNEIGERHGLPAIGVIGFDGKMTREAPAAYVGLDRFDARRAVVADLEATGALVGTTPRRHVVPVSSRSGAVVEPLLSLQWFCKMETLAAPALEAYRSGRLRFVPERFGRTYEAWLENIKDWNVSRQVWWGHQLPVWYTPDDEACRGRERSRSARARARTLRNHRAAPRPRHPRYLVLERRSGPSRSWAGPSVRSNSSTGIPNQVMITGREIIFLWVARMVMLGMHVRGRHPVQRRLHRAAGVRRARPQDVQEPRQLDRADGSGCEIRRGCDPLRNRPPDAARIAGTAVRRAFRAKRRATSITRCGTRCATFAACRKGCRAETGCRRSRASRSRTAGFWRGLRSTIDRVTEAFDGLRVRRGGRHPARLYLVPVLRLVLEATKVPSPTRASVLAYAYNVLMRLLHPIAPFVTEEIWQALPHDGRTIVTAIVARSRRDRRRPAPRRSATRSCAASSATPATCARSSGCRRASA